MKLPTIFHAWQSDSLNNTNRAFIRQPSDEAITRLNAGVAIEEGVEIDRDTKGVPGSPPIAETALRNINKSDVFVGDLTLVAAVDVDGENTARRKKRYPNANVLL